MPAIESNKVYQVSLADLDAFADCAATLDSIKGFLIDTPSEIDLINIKVQRVYDTIERSAGPDIAKIFPEGI